MKKDITKLPSDVQKQVKALEGLPDDQDRHNRCTGDSPTGPTPGAESSTGR